MLDTGTLFAFSISLAALLAGSLLWAWKLGAKLPGTGYWALGGLLMLIGVIGYEAGLADTSPFVNLVSNVANLAGMGALLVGTGVILGMRADLTWALGGAALGAACLILGTWVVPSYTLRVGGYSAAAVLVWGRMVAVLLARREAGLGSIRLASAGCAAGLGACYAARAAYTAATPVISSAGSTAHDRWFLFALVSLYVAFGLCQLQMVFCIFRRDIGRAMEEKNLLFREMNHRVKNSLALVSGMISLQMARIRDEETLDACEELSGRINAVARLHDILHRGGSVREVRLLPYLEAIVESVDGLAPGIEIRAEGEDACLSLDRAVPFGIIANELVTNAVKHGFPSGTRGLVDVRLALDGERIELVVVDRVRDGVLAGSAEDLARRERGLGVSGGQGRLILDALVSQLGAELSYGRSPEGGTVARLLVPTA